MDDYKVSKSFKCTFILNALLFIICVLAQNDTGFAASVVIFVILGVSVEILEAIHKTNNQ